MGGMTDDKFEIDSEVFPLRRCACSSVSENNPTRLFFYFRQKDWGKPLKKKRSNLRVCHLVGRATQIQNVDMNCHK